MERDESLTPAAQSLTERERNLKTLTLVVYALLALGFVTGWVAPVVGVIINYVKKEDVAGTWLESHFRWQIRTFWFGLLWLCVGAVLLLAFFLGVLVWLAAGIWVIYRIVKGALFLLENRPMPV